VPRPPAWSWLFFGAFAACVGAGIAWIILQRTTLEPQQAAQALVQRLEPKQRLITTTAHVQVVARVEDKHPWLGDAQVFAVLPGKIHYSVDLSKVTPAALRYDDANRHLKIRLPALEWSVEPDLKRLEIIRALGPLRTERGIGNALETRVLNQAQSDLENLAKSPDVQTSAQAQTRAAVRALYQSALSAVREPVQVEVLFSDEAGAGS
jgi:Protein of unknown function (DUF4230)